MNTIQGFRAFLNEAAKNKKEEKAPVIKVGDRVRSYDFPGMSDNCYIEGKVTHSDDTYHYIDVDKKVFDGAEKFGFKTKVRAPRGAHQITGKYGVQLADQKPVNVKEGLDESNSLWKYNKVTGVWKHERNVTPDTAKQWLDIHSKDEPNEHFRLAKTKPTHNPLKEDFDNESVNEHIIEVDGKFRLVSKSTGKNLGTYDTRAGAEQREREVEYFKHKNESVVSRVLSKLKLDESTSDSYKQKLVDQLSKKHNVHPDIARAELEASEWEPKDASDHLKAAKNESEVQAWSAEMGSFDAHHPERHQTIGWYSTKELALQKKASHPNGKHMSLISGKIHRSLVKESLDEETTYKNSHFNDKKVVVSTSSGERHGTVSGGDDTHVYVKHDDDGKTERYNPKFVKIKESLEESFMSIYRKNEDNNFHSENLVHLAKHYGSKADHETAKKLLANHERRGYLSQEDSNIGYEIHKRLWPKVQHNESTEYLDEVSKQTLGDYIEKASSTKFSSGAHAQEEISNGNFDSARNIIQKNMKRTVGILKAVKRLTKESIDEAVKPQEELSLDIVKHPNITQELEGAITPIPHPNKAKLHGFDWTEDADGYSATHLIKNKTTGACHTAYTRNGELRIRPYGKTSGTIELVAHLTKGLNPVKAMRESTEELDEGKVNWEATINKNLILAKRAESEGDHEKAKHHRSLADIATKKKAMFNGEQWKKQVEESEDLDESVTEHPFDHVWKKCKNGEWDTQQDIVPGRHLEVTDTKTKKKKMIFVSPGKKDVRESVATSRLGKLINKATEKKPEVSQEEKDAAYAAHIDSLKKAKSEYVKSNPNSIYKNESTEEDMKVKELLDEEYSPKNPKIDLYHKEKGYLASTKWSPTVKHAVAAYEEKHPEHKGMISGRKAK